MRGTKFVAAIMLGPRELEDWFDILWLARPG